jgi:general secretion pathway protein C
MLKKLTAVLVHVLMLALVSAIGAYWAIKIVTPQPTPAPPPLAAPPPRDPDPALAARLFGLVQQAQQAMVSNITVTGVFAAGADSSAVLAVDGKPPRAYVIGQEVTPGTRLVEVRADAAVVEGAAGRQELRVPPRPVAPMATGSAPQPAFTLQGNVLSAPSGAAAPPPLRPGLPGGAPAFAPGGTPSQPMQPVMQPAPAEQPANMPPKPPSPQQ